MDVSYRCAVKISYSVHIYYSNILNNGIYIRSQQEGFDPECEEKVKSSTCPASQEVHVKVTMKVSILLTAPRSAQPYGCSSGKCQAGYRGTLWMFRHCGNKVAFQKGFLLPILVLIGAARSVLQGVPLPLSKGNDYNEHTSFCKGFWKVFEAPTVEEVWRHFLAGQFYLQKACSIPATVYLIIFAVWREYQEMGAFFFNCKSKELVEDCCKTRRSDSAVNQQ